MSAANMRPELWTYMLDRMTCAGRDPTHADWMWRLAFCRRFFL